ncbi:MAG: hypothetical protein ACYC0T_01460 [Ramlibacter sp.]
MNGAEPVRATRRGALGVHPRAVDQRVPETALRSYEPAYDAFLRKPFGLDELLDTLHRLQVADR